MTVAVVEYNAGNIRSVTNALTRLGAPFEVTSDRERISNAERVILPGVGEARSAMTYLRAKGLYQTLSALQQPVLGICLGLQLFCSHSSENDTECLGVIENKVTRFSVPRKVPHTGWSRVFHAEHPIFEAVEQGSYLYFVHSYRAQISPATVATCTYEEDFSAAVANRNFFGVQFHPEKSGAVGQQILMNFLRWQL
jgi:glutamine amidotransferase